MTVSASKWTPGLLPRVDPAAQPESASAGILPWTIITRPAGWRLVDLRELWQYRELLYFLAVRDIKVRYKQTALGAAWALLQPLLTMVVFTIFFGSLAGLDQHVGTVPYSLFTLAALLPWQLFSYALTQSSNSLVNEQRLLSKVYFPRLFLPLAPILSGLVDFAIAFGCFVPMMLYHGIRPGWPVLALPLFVGLAVLTSLAVGLWLSALNVLYRDVRYVIPFLTQFWMYVTPIAYPVSIVPERWQTLYALNPMVGVVEGFRWALLGSALPSVGTMLVSLLAVLGILVSGLCYFRSLEDTIADVV